MRRTRRALLLTVALATGLLAPSAALAAAPPGFARPIPATPTPPTARDEVLVRFRADATPLQRRAVTRDLDLTVVRSSHSGRTALVRGKGVSPATVRRQLAADPRVAAVGRNYQRELAADPTDEPYFKYEWGLYNTGQSISGVETSTGTPDVDIDGLEAIRVQQGKPGIVVAVIDDGVDLSHPDLVGRGWTNPGETAGNGVDDDGNGYIDDIHGWDFCHDDNTVHDDGHDGHGTHVAGTIAANMNGSGTVGVAPGVKIMALKFIDDVDVCGSDAMAIEAIDYAADNGATLINASWGGTDKNDVLDQTIADSGVLFVAASGNSGTDLDAPGVDFYPAESNAANILTVGAIDMNGELASFTNYGATAVDLFAPGFNILSTFPDQTGCNPCYAWSNGTSMAAPHVTGIAALALSKASPPTSTSALRAHVLAAAMPLAQASCFSATGRLANAYRAVTSFGPTAMPLCTWKFDAGTIIGSGVSSTLSWQPATGSFSGGRYVVLRRRGSGPWTTISTQTSRSIRQTLVFGTTYRYATRTKASNGSLGPLAYGQPREATLFQEGTSLARYSGTWTTTTSSSASGGKLRTSTKAGSYVEFKRATLAIAVVGRRSATSGQAKIYVDGVLRSTIDLRRSTTQNRVVLFSTSWTTVATHAVRVVVVGTSGRPRIDIDGFAIAR
jgi:subtilisin family serine protease